MASRTCPRLLDKARATAANQNGDHVYGAMMDRHLFAFTGIDVATFLSAVQTGKSDIEMLRWVMVHLRPARGPSEIAPWSAWFEALGPAHAASHAWLAERIQNNGPQRDEIRTYGEHLDLDDYAAFGGHG